MFAPVTLPMFRAPDGVDERLLGEDERDDYGEEEDELSDDDTPVYEDEKTKETMAQFLTRMAFYSFLI